MTRSARSGWRPTPSTCASTSTTLAAKAYWEQLSPSPEFVVLFVPGDAFLAAALDRDPALLEDAFRKRVHIATPTTLISVLRTVAYAWQQEALADNAREVFDLGQELYKRLGTLGGHMDKLGRSLTSAVKTYNDTVGSLETKVLSTRPQAQRDEGRRRSASERRPRSRSRSARSAAAELVRPPRGSQRVASRRRSSLTLVRRARSDRGLRHRRRATTRTRLAYRLLTSGSAAGQSRRERR